MLDIFVWENMSVCYTKGKREEKMNMVLCVWSDILRRLQLRAEASVVGCR